MQSDTQLLAGIALLVSGIILAVPFLYEWLSSFTGGIAWVQIVIGIAAVVLSVMLIFPKN